MTFSPNPTRSLGTGGASRCERTPTSPFHTSPLSGSTAPSSGASTHLTSRDRALQPPTDPGRGDRQQEEIQGAEPTNNEGSRRGAVRRFRELSRKLSHGRRSERGSRFFERIMTVVETLRGCREDVVGFLTRVMTRHAEAKSQPLLPLAA